MANLAHYYSYHSKKSFKPPDINPAYGGKWLQTKYTYTGDEMPEEDVLKYIKESLWRVNNMTSYYDHYCSRIDSDANKRLTVFTKKDGGIEQWDPKESIFLKRANDLYNRDSERLVMQPPESTRRIIGYAPHRHYQAQLSEYQDTISQLGFRCLDTRLMRRIIKPQKNRLSHQQL